jgi:hypothetical protein
MPCIKVIKVVEESLALSHNCTMTDFLVDSWEQLVIYSGSTNCNATECDWLST